MSNVEESEDDYEERMKAKYGPEEYERRRVAAGRALEKAMPKMTFGLPAADPIYKRDVQTAIAAYRAAHDAHYRAQRMNLPPTISNLVTAGWKSAKDDLVAVLTDRQTQPYLRENIMLLLDAMAAPIEKVDS